MSNYIIILLIVILLINFKRLANNLNYFLFIYLVVDSIFLLFKSHDLFLRFTIINNLHDGLGIISLGIFLYNINHLTPTVVNRKGFKILLIFMSIFLLYMFLSLTVHGITAIKANRYHLSGQLFLLGLVSYSFLDKHKVIDSFVLFLRLKTIITILFFFLRAFDILPMLYEGQLYQQIRYLTNEQTLFLVFYFIFLTSSVKSYIKPNKIDNFLIPISFILVIISTQRAVTYVFILYLLYALIFSKSFNKKTIIKLAVFGIIGIIFVDIEKTFNLIKYALYENVFEETESSTGYGKYQDVFASIEYMIKNKLFFTGRLFQAEMFERSKESFYSPATRGIHNLFVTYFVTGGLILIIPYLLLWYKLIRYNLKRLILKTDLYSETIFWLLVSTFLFVNSSGGALVSSFVLGFSILMQSNSVYEKPILYSKK